MPDLDLPLGAIGLGLLAWLARWRDSEVLRVLRSLETKVEALQKGEAAAAKSFELFALEARKEIAALEKNVEALEAHFSRHEVAEDRAIAELRDLVKNRDSELAALREKIDRIDRRLSGRPP